MTTLPRRLGVTHLVCTVTASAALWAVSGCASTAPTNEHAAREEPKKLVAHPTPAPSPASLAALDTQLDQAKALTAALQAQRDLLARASGHTSAELVAARNAVQSAQRKVAGEPTTAPSPAVTVLPSPAEEATRLQAVADEVAYRRAQRELAAQSLSATPEEKTSAEEKKRQAQARVAAAREKFLVTLDTQLGQANALTAALQAQRALLARTPPATEAEIAAARDTVRQAREQIARSMPDIITVPTPAEEVARLRLIAQEVAARRARRELQAANPSATTEELDAAEEKARQTATKATATRPAASTAETPAELQQRLDAVEKEVARRRALRETAAGQIPPGTSAKASRPSSGKLSLRMPAGDIASLASFCTIYFERPVTVADRIARRSASLTLSADSREDMQKKLRDELGKIGLDLVERPEGLLLDSAPAPAPVP